MLTSVTSRFSFPGLKIVTSNWPSYEVVQPLGALPLGAMSSVTAWGMAKAVAARARRASDVLILILESNYVIKKYRRLFFVEIDDRCLRFCLVGSDDESSIERSSLLDIHGAVLHPFCLERYNKEVAHLRIDTALFTCQPVWLGSPELRYSIMLYPLKRFVGSHTYQLFSFSALCCGGKALAKQGESHHQGLVHECGWQGAE